MNTEQHSGLFWFFNDARIMAVRSILHITRSLDQLLSALMFPIMFLLLNRFVLGGAINTGDVEYANYLLAGILVQTLAFGANYTTINIAVDLQHGFIDRIRSLPMHGSALVIGHVIADLARNILSGFIVILVGLLIGFRPTASIEEWLAVLGLAIIFSLAISWLSAILGLFVKSLEAAQWVGFVVIFPLTFISSAFVPTSTMPTALRLFAENQPLTQVMNAMRAWLVGTPLGNSHWIALLWCLVIIALSLPFATYLFRKQGN